MSNPYETTRPNGKVNTRKTGGHLSNAERRRRKGAVDRRYYRRRRRGCGVTAYLASPEVKKALVKKLRPLGLTVSQAISQLLTAVAEGRLSLYPTPDAPAFDPGDLDDAFLELDAKQDLHQFNARWGGGRS
jgi:hypothetical protein